MVWTILAAAALVTTGTAATHATAVPVVPVVPAVSSSSVTVSSTNMPPRMVAVWQQARREKRRTADLLARGAIDAAEAARRRAAIPRAFARVCRAKGIPAAEIDRWLEEWRRTNEVNSNRKP